MAMSPSPRASACPPSPRVETGLLTPANSGRLITLSRITLATMLPPAGFERMTPFALFSTAANFSTVEISGCGAPARTASPISERREGAGYYTAVERQRAHQLVRKHDHIRGRIVAGNPLHNAAHSCQRHCDL